MKIHVFTFFECTRCFCEFAAVRDDNALLVSLFKNAIKINENIRNCLVVLSTAHNHFSLTFEKRLSAIQPNTICQLNENRTINLHKFVAKIFASHVELIHEVKGN